MTFAALEAIFRALNEQHVRFVVVGGVAVNAHGYQRLTQDLDLVVELEPENVRAALRALEGLGYSPVLPVRAADFADPEVRRRWVETRGLQVFSLGSDLYRLTVDLFATEPFDFADEYDAALVAAIAPGLEVRFVRLDTLIAMKRATGRPRDTDDAEHLKMISEELLGDDEQ